MTLDLFLFLAWQAETAEAALAAARAELEAAARDDISPSRTQAARERIAALEADCCRLKVHALPQPPYAKHISAAKSVHIEGKFWLNHNALCLESLPRGRKPSSMSIYYANLHCVRKHCHADLQLHNSHCHAGVHCTLNAAICLCRGRSQSSAASWQRSEQPQTRLRSRLLRLPTAASPTSGCATRMTGPAMLAPLCSMCCCVQSPNVVWHLLPPQKEEASW